MLNQESFRLTLQAIPTTIPIPIPPAGEGLVLLWSIPLSHGHAILPLSPNHGLNPLWNHRPALPSPTDRRRIRSAPSPDHGPGPPDYGPAPSPLTKSHTRLKYSLASYYVSRRYQ